MDWTGLLLKWYDEHKRDLPWRHTRDPYEIWVSEVILQQTRVYQGLSYYYSFLRSFPDIQSLASAPLEQVMKVWQGLGYYSRARHMHEAANEICKHHNGLFPDSYEEIRKLKGIGDYTASAIASIVYNQPSPVVDGNVLRVVSRFQGINEAVNAPSTRKKIRGILDRAIDKSRPGDFNQAMMELGATVCTPRKPSCMECPLNDRCYALRKGLVSSLPVMEKSKPKMVQYFNYLVFIEKKGDDWFTWLNKRDGKGIWKNLYDFPLIETAFEADAAFILSSREFKRIIGKQVNSFTPVSLEKTRHILTHKELRVTFLIVEVQGFHQKDLYATRLEDSHKYPVPRLIENFFKKVMNRPGINSNFPD